jgi:hypothetical protein
MTGLSMTSIALGCLLLLPKSGFAHEPESGVRQFEIAGPDPDRIFLSFHGDPATRRAVTWRTDSSIEAASAQIAPSTGNPKFGESAITVPAVTETVDLNLHNHNRQGQVNYHSVIFTGLQADTLYAYRVGSDRYWSEWIQFRTAKLEPAPFSFVYFGDAQNEILSKWSRVIRMSYEKAPGASFAIHAGDLVNNGHFDSEWAEWFKAGGWIHSQRTGIPVVGNHEIRPLPDVAKGKTLSIVWRPQFTLPEESNLPEALRETVYTIDYQGVRIIVLNSSLEEAAQVDYLREQLQRPGAKWTILTSHYSILTLRPKRDYLSSRLWLPVIEEFGVDLVLQGHDHLYARFQKPLRTTVADTEDGFRTMFVTSVSGPKQYKIEGETLNGVLDKGYDLEASGEQKQFFQVINVDEGTLTYTAYMADGEVYDRVTIEKDPDSGIKSLLPDKSEEDTRRAPNPWIWILGMAVALGLLATLLLRFRKIK